MPSRDEPFAVVNNDVRLAFNGADEKFRPVERKSLAFAGAVNASQLPLTGTEEKIEGKERAGYGQDGESNPKISAGGTLRRPRVYLFFKPRRQLIRGVYLARLGQRFPGRFRFLTISRKEDLSSDVDLHQRLELRGQPLKLRELPGGLSRNLRHLFRTAGALRYVDLLIERLLGGVLRDLVQLLFVCLDLFLQSRPRGQVGRVEKIYHQVVESDLSGRVILRLIMEILQSPQSLFLIVIGRPRGGGALAQVELLQPALSQRQLDVHRLPRAFSDNPLYLHQSFISLRPSDSSFDRALIGPDQTADNQVVARSRRLIRIDDDASALAQFEPDGPPGHRSNQSHIPRDR